MPSGTTAFTWYCRCAFEEKQKAVQTHFTSFTTLQYGVNSAWANHDMQVICIRDKLCTSCVFCAFQVLAAVRTRVRVIGCQPANSCVMMQCVRAGRILDLPSTPTLSDGTAGACCM